MRHAIRDPQRDQQYATLKDAILNEFRDSCEIRIRRLLSQSEIAETRLSRILNRLCDIVEGRADDELLRAMWFERLPELILLILLEIDLDAIAKTTDRIYDSHKKLGDARRREKVDEKYELNVQRRTYSILVEEERELR